MSYLDGGKVIDLMFGLPDIKGLHAAYEGFKPLYRDRESRDFAFPAQYMFKDIPNIEDVGDDPVSWAVKQMDRFNIEKALIGINPFSDLHKIARDKFADRFIFDVGTDPNGGVDEIRRIKQLTKEYDVKAVSVFPCGCNPQVPINDKRLFVTYATCCELDLPIFVNVGVPGPRVPMAPQMTELVDEVCWFFPELKFIMRHGSEPWESLAMKLMLKYPNLYYSTSAFAPKHYPKAIIDYANTRGADKIMYAGYFPMGLSLDRIFRELREVPFKESVWPKFMYGNAKRVLRV
ncbi:MAG TPA: amidohydrolase family protein [Alphaproteobacteria bacterium]|nr:amidohydrolase family protein [Alphaproteobacteria bacterium]